MHFALSIGSTIILKYLTPRPTNEERLPITAWVCKFFAIRGRVVLVARLSQRQVKPNLQQFRSRSQFAKLAPDCSTSRLDARRANREWGEGKFDGGVLNLDLL